MDLHSSQLFPSAVKLTKWEDNCCVDSQALRHAGIDMSTELGTALINAYCKGGSEGIRHAERILQSMLVCLSTYHTTLLDRL